MVLQWLTGQGHRHLMVSEREKFKITFKFQHNCQLINERHTVCYPIVSACADTVTFPTAHMGDYDSFKTIFLTAMKFAPSFDRA